MSDWQRDEVPIFDPPWNHPDSAYAGPTPAQEVLFFAVKPRSNWQTFEVVYEGPIRLRYRRVEGRR